MQAYKYTDEYLDFLSDVRTGNNQVYSGHLQIETIQVLDKVKILWIMALLLTVFTFGQSVKASLYHIEDFYQNDTNGKIQVWVDQENIINLSWTWTENSCGSGYIWTTNDQTEIGQILLTVLKTGQESDELSEAVIVNGENVNEFLTRWHNYTKTDHPLTCKVFLPIITN